jgi:hypothetical protein
VAARSIGLLREGPNQQVEPLSCQNTGGIVLTFECSKKAQKAPRKATFDILYIIQFPTIFCFWLS